MDTLIGIYGGFLVELVCFFLPMLISLLVYFEDGKNQAIEDYNNQKVRRKQAYLALSQQNDVDHDEVARKQTEEAKRDKKKKDRIENLLNPKLQIFIIYGFLFFSGAFLILQGFIREGLVIKYSHENSICCFFLSLLFCLLALIQIGRVLYIVTTVILKKSKA